MKEQIQMLGQLQDKTIVITGGCGDIGKATALRLTKEGARAVLFDVDLPPAVKLELKSQFDSGEITYVQADVTNHSALQAAFEIVVDKFKRLDVVIANAGIVRNQKFLEITLEDWQRTLDVNLGGAFLSAQIASRIMLKQEPSDRRIRGKILFTGSWVQDMPWPEGAAYITSKGGVKMLAKTMAQELASLGIRVNVLAPGIVMAGLSKKIYEVDSRFRERVGEAIPLGEMQTAESVADAFAFLCSSDSDYMTGAVLVVDGGASLVRRN